MKTNSNENTLKFSVLMSVYYKEKSEHFDLALKSILVNQIKKPDEFILVADGKLTNELNLIIKKYCDLFPSILFVYRLDKNVGLGKALNFGIEKCTNEIIARADSDDICHPDRFYKQITRFSNSMIDILGSYISEFETEISRPKNIKTVPAKCNEVIQMAKFRNPINHMTVVFRKSKIQKCGSYKHMPFLEDYYLWIRAILNGLVLENIEEVLVYARVGNGMIERRSNKQYILSWTKLNRYMKNAKFIGQIRYIRNILAVRIFVYLPLTLKKIIYRYVLRRKL